MNQTHWWLKTNGCNLVTFLRITVIGGLAGRAEWRAGFPNEKRELLAGCTEDRRAGRRAALKGGPAGCGKGRAAKKSSLPVRPFPQTSSLCPPPACLMCSPLACPVVQHALLCSSSACRKFNFFIWQHGPPARPALHLLVLSLSYNLCIIQQTSMHVFDLTMHNFSTLFVIK